MDNLFSFKDLEKVKLKATYNMKLGNRDISKGETIVSFDKIQIAFLNEIKSHISANGGFENRGRVFWDTSEKLQLNFSQGVFSQEQLAILINANIANKSTDQIVLITEEELLESDENGNFTLKHVPANGLFIYDNITNAKITNYTVVNNTVTITDVFKPVRVNYVYEYRNVKTEYLIGQNLLNGFVELEGRTKIKDDVTGQVVTGIFKIPHLRLMSNLSIRLGAQANPVIGNFMAEGIPVGSRGDAHISEFYILGEDIESDL